jgi:L-cysteine desulfidase
MLEVLGGLPDTIEVFLRPNILKNAMGLGIPHLNDETDNDITNVMLI